MINSFMLNGFLPEICTAAPEGGVEMKKFAILTVFLVATAFLFAGCASIKIYATDGSVKNASKREAWKYVRPKQEMEAKYKNMPIPLLQQKEVDHK